MFSSFWNRQGVNENAIFSNAVDINEVKKAVNPDGVDETERYEFRWFGKSKAKRNAFMPTRATLHYDEERLLFIVWLACALKVSYSLIGAL